MTLGILRKTSMHDGSSFGWEITCYDDITKIEYWEKEGEQKTTKSSFEISEQYDLEVFKEAIRMRE